MDPYDSYGQRSHESWVMSHEFFTLTVGGSTWLRGLFLKVRDSKRLVVKTIHMLCMVYRSQTDIVTVDRIFRIFLVVSVILYKEAWLHWCQTSPANLHVVQISRACLRKLGVYIFDNTQKEAKIWPLMAQFVHPRSLTARPMKIIVGRRSGLLLRPFIEFQG